MNAKNLFAAVAVLFLAGFAQGAHLTHYDSGLWGQVDFYINDSDGQITPPPSADFGNTSCVASMWAETEQSYASGSMSGEVSTASYWGPGLGTAITLNANASCDSEDSSANLWAYGNVGTLAPAYTDGIFFTIEPDEEETTGVPVQIQWHWSAECFALYGDAQASIFADRTMYLTRNVTPPTGWPTDGIEWSRPGVIFTEPDLIGETGSFNAEIGDVIGLFLGADASANLSGAGASTAAVHTSMELLVVPEPATVCLLGLGAMSLLRKKIKGAY